MTHKPVVAAKTHNFVSGVFVTYLGFFEGIIWGFTKNLSGSINRYRCFGNLVFFFRVWRMLVKMKINYQQLAFSQYAFLSKVRRFTIDSSKQA